MLSTVQKEQIISHYIEAYNTFDITGMLNDLHPDIHFVNRSNGDIQMTLQGLDEFGKQAHEASTLFTEREQRINGFKHEGHVTETTISYHAVLALDLPNGMKKGAALDLKGTSIFTFSGDKIVKIEDLS
jgi:hypothetical protein